MILRSVVASFLVLSPLLAHAQFESLIQQEKTEEARLIAEQDRTEILRIRDKIIKQEPDLLQDFWVSQQPEILKLADLNRKIKNLELKLSPQFEGEELVLKLNQHLNRAFRVKSIKCSVDSDVLTNENAHKIEPGKHKLKIDLIYQIANGEVSSLIEYHLSQTYTFVVHRGDFIRLEVLLSDNKKNHHKPKLTLAISVEPTDLDLLEKLKEQLKNIQLEYESASKQLIEASQPKWIAQLDEQIFENDKIVIAICSVERFKLQKRIAQIEQVKTAEIKRAHSDSVERISLYYDDALEALKKKENQEREMAVQQFELFLQSYPRSSENSQILLSLADLYFDSDLSKSILLTKELIQKYPSSEQIDSAYYLLGISYQYDGDIEQAEKIYRQLIKNYPESAHVDEVSFRLAEIYFDRKEYEAAEVLFEKLQDYRALYKSAWINYLQNNYSKAIEKFAQLLDSDSVNSDILRQEASRYLAISLLDSSQTPALFDGKTWARSVWIHFGNILEKSDRNQEASKAFELAILLDPENTENQNLDLRILDLNPSAEVKKSFISKYIDHPQSQEVVRRILLESALESHSQKLFKESAEAYALFINHFPEAENLDQILLYYSEALFDARLYHHAAIGFKQLRDWPWQTEHRQKAATNAVYAYAQEIQYDISVIDIRQKARFEGEIPQVMLSYIEAVDILAKQFPDFSDTPSQLVQAAGIYYAYGNLVEANQRFERLIELYPKQEAARVAAQIIIGDYLEKEDWLMAAQSAKRFQNLSKDFVSIEKNAQFKYLNKLYGEAQTPEAYSHVADLYLQILKENPQTELADKILYNAAISLDRSKRYEEADDVFETLYSNFPTSSLTKNSRQQRALYFEQRLLFEKAASVYLKISGDKSALLRAALDYEAAQRFDKAALLFERSEAPEALMKAEKAYRLAGDLKNQTRVSHEFQNRYKNQIVSVDYLLLEPELKNYQMLFIDGKSTREQTKQLTLKTEKLAELKKSYEKIVKNYDLSHWTLASIYQIGFLYEDLFRSLLKAPCPKDVADIDEAACDEYASLLEDKAFILEKKAIDSYQLVIDQSKQVIGSSEWVLKAKSALYRMKPSDYLPAEALSQELNYEVLVGDLENLQMLAMRQLELNPFDMPARLQMAQIFYAKNQLDAASMTLEDSIEKDNSLALFHLWLGHVYYAQSEYSKAIVSYEKSNLAAAHNNLGLLYLEQNDLEKAFTYLKQANRELNFGNYYFAAKDYASAQAAYEKVLIQEPDHLGVQLNMGLLALSQEHYELAQSAFKKYLEKSEVDANLRTRIESYLKIISQKIQFEKQRHDQNT